MRTGCWLANAGAQNCWVIEARETVLRPLTQIMPATRAATAQSNTVESPNNLPLEIVTAGPSCGCLKTAGFTVGSEECKWKLGTYEPAFNSIRTAGCAVEAW